MATETLKGRNRLQQMLPVLAAEARTRREFIDSMTPQTAGLSRFECRHVERLMDIYSTLINKANFLLALMGRDCVASGGSADRNT